MIFLVNNLYFSHDLLLRYVDSELSQLVVNDTDKSDPYLHQFDVNATIYCL